MKAVAMKDVDSRVNCLDERYRSHHVVRPPMMTGVEAGFVSSKMPCKAPSVNLSNTLFSAWDLDEQIWSPRPRKQFFGLLQCARHIVREERRTSSDTQPSTVFVLSCKGGTDPLFG